MAKQRRHHNTTGDRQIKTGASFRRLVQFAKRLGLKVEGENEVKQLKGETRKCHRSNPNRD